MLYFNIKEVDCGAHPPITDGTSSGGTLFGDIATYTCNAGFTLSGDSTLECQANGAWDPAAAPVCNSKYTQM